MCWLVYRTAPGADSVLVEAFGQCMVISLIDYLNLLFAGSIYYIRIYGFTRITYKNDGSGSQPCMLALNGVRNSSRSSMILYYDPARLCVIWELPKIRGPNTDPNIL